MDPETHPHDPCSSRGFRSANARMRTHTSEKKSCQGNDESREHQHINQKLRLHPEGVEAQLFQLHHEHHRPHHGQQRREVQQDVAAFSGQRPAQVEANPKPQQQSQGRHAQPPGEASRQLAGPQKPLMAQLGQAHMRGAGIHEDPKNGNHRDDALLIGEELGGEVLSEAAEHLRPHYVFEALRATEPDGNALDDTISVTHHRRSVPVVTYAAAPASCALQGKAAQLILHVLNR
mmetsp:Transcript_69570/g.165938  ORF Transcript_69570/g.165938 Transcript_69570/m.165938 type:complete len:233 (-) Transcript_69570:968-1666(-)